MRVIAPDSSEYLSSKIYESKIAIFSDELQSTLTVLESQLRSSIAEASGTGGGGGSISNLLAIEGSIVAGSTIRYIVFSDYDSSLSFVTPICSITGRGVNGGQRNFFIQEKTSSDITVGIDSAYTENLLFDLMILDKS